MIKISDFEIFDEKTVTLYTLTATALHVDRPGSGEQSSCLVIRDEAGETLWAALLERCHKHTWMYVGQTDPNECAGDAIGIWVCHECGQFKITDGKPQ